MSNIEFIPASNLPTTEANEVDVLCVENGELKRKAGASLGGGKLVVIKPEDLYINDAENSGTLILVNAELFAECEKQINGESVLTALYIYEQDGGKYSESLGGVSTHPEAPVAFFYLMFWNWSVYVVKTTADADTLLAAMTE